MAEGWNIPAYRCHKEVRALKIASIETEQMPAFQRATCRGCFALNSACGNCERCDWERSHGPRMSTWLITDEPGQGRIRVTAEYVAKHKPQPGGYYVVYDDGYESFSPGKAFEEGYTRI